MRRAVRRARPDRGEQAQGTEHHAEMWRLLPRGNSGWRSWGAEPIPWRRAGRPKGETPPPLLQPSASPRACVVLASCLRHACNEGTTTRAPPPPHTPSSAQISATTKRGCRPWAGPPWGPGNRGAGFLLPPPPPNRNQAESRPSTAPPPSMPSHPRSLTAGRHMVIKVPPLTDRERTPNDGYVGIWDPHGNPAGGPPLPNK